MQYIFLSIVATALASAVPNDQPGFLRQPLQQLPVNSSDLSRRDSTVTGSLDNDQTQYFVSFSVGTPAQELVGSGARDPLFDSSKSSTYKLVNHDFAIGYVGFSIGGDWIDDTVTLGGAAIKNQRLAVAHESRSVATYGIFGVAPLGTESPKEKYPNFPQGLKDQGFINRVAFSLYLNEQGASSGSILFGAVDRAKYTGKLQKIQFNPGGFETEFKVANHTLTGLLDTGTSYAYLPQDVLDIIGSENGLTWSAEDEYYYTESQPVDSTITYTFGTTDIVVPLSNNFIYDFWSGRHILAIYPVSKDGGLIVLGDIFLRYAYVVFDAEGSEGGIAQVKYTDSSDIVVITDTIPGASD